MSAELERIETLKTRGALVAPGEAPGLCDAWAALCGDLLEENPFFAPEALLPALKAYASERVRLACIWSGEALIALLPVVKRRVYARLPVAYWATWTHPHCYYGAPLIRRGFEEAAFAGLYELLCEGEEGRAFVRLARLDRDRPAMKAAQSAAETERRLAYDAGAVARAMLPSGASAEATLAVHVRKKKRKELARLKKRLEEKGTLTLRLLSLADDLRQWTEDFLALEDKGWKGKAKTSLKSDGKDAAWFRETLAAMDKRAQLHFLRLDLDEKPVAMLATLISNGAAYSLKICHDPDYARYSPGVMIEIEAMRSLLTRPDFRFADSCAAPDHTMINGLWRARRVVTGLNVSGRSVSARGSLGLARLLEGARARLPKG
ncbi:GNAT family N-acetyltransferase [Hyphococcus luteus]|uniref:CelD-like protein n=1 Tax=Hyphococcus luteus TaxID=2058213 RepID=A0A2S7K7A8_9PROT|nr:GNAT family N-acetyltransferase [Marinicaulis flavus]PQA88348.1 CelD-like protein [Marinicaulis flavus]